MKNRLKKLTGIIGALLIAVSPCGSQTMAYASEPTETEAAFYDDGADFEIQEDTDGQVRDQEELDITEEEEDPDTTDIQIEAEAEDTDSEEPELTSDEALFSDSPVEEELFADAAGEEADSYLGVRTQPIIYDDFEEDIWLQFQQRELQVGEQTDIYPRRVPQADVDMVNNDVERPEFNFKVIRGQDVISLDTTKSKEKAVATALKPGTAVIQVNYDAFTHAEGTYFPACSVINTGYAVITVGETGTASITCSDNLENWRHYDTIYYLEGQDTVPFTFTATAAGAANLKVTCNGLEVKPNSDGSYTAALENRSNIIGVVATDGSGNTRSLYRVVDARAIKINIKNTKDNSSEFHVGDTAEVSFTGITMPVYKLATIYNPCFGSDYPEYGSEYGEWSSYVSYKNSILGSYKGKCGQWNLATQNSFQVTFSQAGKYRFNSDGIYCCWWGHRLNYDLKHEGKGPSWAVAPHYWNVFSSMPSFSITVDSGDEVLNPVINKLESLPDANGLTLADEAAVKAAREAYDALNDTQKSLVNSDDLARLTDAEARMAQLHTDIEKAAEVEKILGNLKGASSLTLADEVSVKAAREAYDGLSADQKKLIPADKLKALTAAEAKIAQLKKVTPTPTKKPEPKPSIRLNYTSIPLQVKQSTTAIRIRTTAIKGDKIKSAKSSNSKVAKVSVKNGKLTIKGMKAGKVTVTVTSAKGAKATVKVTVQKKKVALKKLQALTSRKVTVKKGRKTTLKVANSPITAKASVKWKTSNKKVATVTSKGVVKGLKKGRATITAYSGKIKMTYKVTVK